MTGLDRLHGIAEDVGRTVWLRDLGAALRDIADGIEGGTRDLRGYESDVLAWVEKNGGLDAVKERTMPEGMEWLLEVWPKWSNGEYCKFGDWWVSDKYGEPEPEQFRKLSIYTPEQLREWGQDDGDNYGYEWDFLRPSDPKYRPDKVEPPAPKVLDADGVEIRVGDTVYQMGCKYRVSHLHGANGKVRIVYENSGRWVDPKTLTHRAPVLAADGRPLREGETVWNVKTGERYMVGAFASGCVNVSDGRGGGLQLLPSQLTHTKPEPPDTWERIEEDAYKDDCEYFGRDLNGCEGCPASRQDIDNFYCDENEKASDLVRRAKALAGVS